MRGQRPPGEAEVGGRRRVGIIVTVGHGPAAGGRVGDEDERRVRGRGGRPGPREGPGGRRIVWHLSPNSRARGCGEAGTRVRVPAKKQRNGTRARCVSPYFIFSSAAASLPPSHGQKLALLRPPQHNPDPQALKAPHVLTHKELTPPPSSSRLRARAKEREARATPSLLAASARRVSRVFFPIWGDPSYARTHPPPPLIKQEICSTTRPLSRRQKRAAS
jgi:hypothetical protein